MKNIKKYLPFLSVALIFHVPAFAGELYLKVTSVDKFTDLSISGFSAEKTLPIFLQEVEDSLKDKAAEKLPDGFTLTLNFTDIDMAGDIQPWRNRNNADIRYVEDVYPPRIAFDYTIVDNDGIEAAAGSEKLKNLNFLFGNIAVARSNRQFYFETEMLERWFSRDMQKILDKSIGDIASK